MEKNSKKYALSLRVDVSAEALKFKETCANASEHNAMQCLVVRLVYHLVLIRNDGSKLLQYIQDMVAKHSLHAGLEVEKLFEYVYIILKDSVVIESRFFESSKSRVTEVRVRASMSFSPWKVFEFE